MSSKPIYLTIIGIMATALIITLTVFIVNNTNKTKTELTGTPPATLIESPANTNETSYINGSSFLNEVGETLKMTVDTNNNYILSNKLNDIYVKLNFSAIKHEVEDRLPLNLSLVIDRSGSMEGEKLEQAKKAVVAFLESLSPEDYLSIVTYESGVAKLYAQSKVENLSGLKDKILSITSAGGTFLSGGLNEGINQVLSKKNDNFINRVILFSDGQANEGVSDIEGLKKIAEKASSQGVSVSTMGVGLDYDENIMSAIAIGGSGNYQFIKDAEQISSVLSKELSQLKSIVASRAVVKIVHDPAISFVTTYGYTYKSQNGYVEVPIRDFFSEDKGQAILHFISEGKDISDYDLRISLEYNDAIKDNQFMTFDTGVALSMISDQKIYNDNLNTVVMSEIIKLENTLAMEEANKALERGDIMAANEIYKEKIDNNIFFINKYGNINGLEEQNEYMSKQKDMAENFDMMSTEETKSALKYNRMYNMDQQQGRANDFDNYSDNN